MFQAIYRAEQDFQVYQHLLRSFLGVVFVSTPHIVDLNEDSRLTILRVLSPDMEPRRLERSYKRMDVTAIVDICRSFSVLE